VIAHRDRRRVRLGESGAALIIVVLLMMALTAIAHGLLLLARFEFLAARAGADQLGARLAAEAAVSTLLVSEASPGLASTALWRSTDSTSGTLLDASFSGSIRRLSRELWMAEGWGMRGRVTPAEASRALWILDPVARVAASTAVLLHGEGTLAQHHGTVDGSRVNEIPTPEPPEGCQRMSEALDSLLPRGVLPPTGVQPMHAVATLGALDLDSMRARIQARVEGVGTPEPRQRAGVCLTEYVWNWGDPGRPSQPCGRHLVTILAEGDLAVAGGVGQGLLVVIGDADLLDTRFSGLLIVGGRLTLRGSATVLGLVRAARGASLEQGASIVGSTCWATASLTSPILARPVPVRGPRFLGPR
jgi:hypothetical protein